MSKCNCILPYIHQEIQQSGDVLVCARTQGVAGLGNLKEQTPKELWNSQKLKNIRLQMSKDSWPKECYFCKEDEKYGQTSLRKQVNERYKNYLNLFDTLNDDGSLDDYKLKFIGIKHSNFCNLTCIYCDHQYSTSWGIDKETQKPLEPFPGGNKELISYVESHIETLESLYITGGESLIDPRHLEFLEYFSDHPNAKNIILIYNSNLTSIKIKNTDLIPLWEKFKKVHISASLDDYGDRFEFIRHGGKWNKIEKNITELKKNNIDIDIYMTITNLNIYYFTDFIDYMMKEFAFNLNQFTVNLLKNPTRLALNNIDHAFSKKCIEKIEKFKKNLIFKFSDDLALKVFLPQLVAIENMLKEYKENKDFVNDILLKESPERKKDFIDIFQLDNLRNS